MKKVKDIVVWEKYHGKSSSMGHTCNVGQYSYSAVYEKLDEYVSAKAVFEMSEADIENHARRLYDDAKNNHDISYCRELARKQARIAAEDERRKLNREEEVIDKPVYAVCRHYEGVDRLTDFHYEGTAIEALATSKEVAMEIMSMAKSFLQDNTQQKETTTQYGEFRIDEVKEKTKE